MRWGRRRTHKGEWKKSEKVVQVRGGREERASTESRGGYSEAVEATTSNYISRDALPFSPAPAWPNSQ